MNFSALILVTIVSQCRSQFFMSDDDYSDESDSNESSDGKFSYFFKVLISLNDFLLFFFLRLLISDAQDDK